VQPDQYLGQPGEVLDVADCPLGQLDPDEHARSTAARRGSARGGQGHRGGDRQADEQQHRVGVQLGGQSRIQAGARGVGVARVRAASGDHGAEVEHRRHHREQRHPGSSHRRGDDG